MLPGIAASLLLNIADAPSMDRKAYFLTRSFASQMPLMHSQGSQCLRFLMTPGFVDLSLQTLDEQQHPEHPKSTSIQDRSQAW